MIFNDEKEFEDALVNILIEKHGWNEVLLYPTEKDLIKNWANILYENNNTVDRLNNCPLTDGEMKQIIEQINQLRTPLKLNSFINGKTISVKRDNTDDKNHFGKEITLKIYDRNEIIGGQSVYQIVRQPIFSTKSKMLNNRRGDIMLLINGMPVIHIELKHSGIPISQAYNQIEKYSHEGVFTGLFSLVQIFVAMKPDETLYFANPGPDGKFDKCYYFQWANFDNEPIKDWKEIASSLLSIPMAHKLIGFYTVADNADGVLKVMRSYQYYAASKISDVVAKTKWDSGKQRGGYVWHTTGSGKTMTSFKSAQLITNSNDADKVIFLTDRIELGTQSLKEYRAFADDNESVQATESTYVLLGKLKSNATADTLIVTSIQKMSNIQKEDGGLNANDIDIISKKRVVFIVDEAHRSTFGDMLAIIKETFPNAIFFGFTGTPLFDENSRKNNSQTDVFGNELHRYSIADGIRDKNVLGFDIYKVLTYKDSDLRKAVALDKAKAETEEEAMSDPDKMKIFTKYTDPSQVQMAGHKGENGKWVKGIEDLLPKAQYLTSEHENKVIEDIKENWKTKSLNGKFHAIFATSSILEAVDYYRMMKRQLPNLKITGLFDPNIDNVGGAIHKEEGLAEIIEDYNELFEQDFTIASHASFKKDVSLRLAHKEQYKWLAKTPEKQIDILIVVDQMLTGFDSKWVNTIYMDKVLKYENIIQAFSRTNRLFGEEKRFGIIRYYRKPHTMEKNIEEAVKLYSGDRPLGLFVEKLPENLKRLNSIYEEIEDLFNNSDVTDFHKLPENMSVKAKFATLFKELNDCVESAKIQDFSWNKKVYTFTDENNQEYSIEVKLDETTFLTLAQRYKELAKEINTDNTNSPEIPYEINGYLTEIDTGLIDANYMNSRFEKYYKLITQDDSSAELIAQAEAELHKSFASLSQDEQKYANIFLHDIQCGDVVIEEGKTFRDYITEYQYKTQDNNIRKCAEAFGLDMNLLVEIMKSDTSNINEFGRFDKLLSTVDKAKAKAFLEKREGKKIIMPKVHIQTDNFLRGFIKLGGFVVDES